ncbi:uncharacterized protein BP01DRAFT_86903 [Aspergillus saccharolyticus JOP 1030-1]|uniref:Secreted protein n=1 Tax=Aspergillus saccharolyticus JOP 1030-1 TaxID=1450539 RepID=A0A318ZAF0_9EURO|nr:hypothetical protein BP01DRAFT_86903 [Aspergillus saccharolyticus JOP 1030-1]PYH44316.1 hypothetical protein BP01DRAFT_86903 [Aspergillus saccharolyticus JOP 1030-1]
MSNKAARAVFSLFLVLSVVSAFSSCPYRIGLRQQRNQGEPVDCFSLSRNFLFHNFLSYVIYALWRRLFPPDGMHSACYEREEKGVYRSSIARVRL